MIPPLLMDLKPGMTVLDMCAAPGSKSCQLIEMIHEGEEARMEKQQGRATFKNGELSPHGDELGEDWSDDGRATGLLIANDSDYKRAHMLIHQMKRLNSPNLIVTNHDASIFPSIKLPSRPGAANNQYLKFDRILADVPCTGDGTSRKNPIVWRDWTPANGIGLHDLQFRILMRALQMLKTGGRVVYSTCSMNPVENEAVVASAIIACGGNATVEIVECNDRVPELARRPGIASWQVMDKSGRTWSSWPEVQKHIQQSGPDFMGKISRGQFPPSPSENLHLERCMRVYPHLQDTGSFFITVLEKKKAISVSTQPQSKPQHQAKAVQPSVISAVNEIEERTANGVDPSSKIETLDALIPQPAGDRDAEGVSAAARQNMENAPTEPVTAAKRVLDEQGDASAETKRLKLRDDKDADYPAVQGGEDRQVHYPPPPGAQLEISRPETMEEPPPPEPNLLISDHRVSQSVPNHISQPATNLPTRNPINQHGKPPFEEPFKYLPASHPVLSEVTDFYDLYPTFPRDRFMVRNAAGVPTKTIYYTCTLARDILITNSGAGLKFVHCGVKMFAKQETQGEGVCPWRIQNEGIALVEKFIGEERLVTCWRRSTLKKLLQEMFPKVGGEGWKDLGEVGLQVKDRKMGCLVLRVESRVEDHTNGVANGDDGEPVADEDDEDKNPFMESLVLPLWRSLHSVNLMLPKEERKAMLLRLYGIEMSEIKDTSKERFEKKQQQQQQQKNVREESPSASNRGNDKVMRAGTAPLDMPDGPTPEVDDDAKSRVRREKEEHQRGSSSRRKGRRNTSSPEPIESSDDEDGEDGGGKIFDGGVVVQVAKSGDLDTVPGKEAGDAMDVEDDHPTVPNMAGT